MLLLRVYSWARFLIESLSSLFFALSSDSFNSISGSKGLYWGLTNDSAYPAYIGIITLDSSGKNFPRSKFAETSYSMTSSLLLSLTFFSILPNPGVLMLPDKLIVPKSANWVATLPLAAHPPSSLKSVNRNSLTHTSADLGIPSSFVLFCTFCLLGFLTPIIIVTTLLRFGFPFTDSFALSSS